MLKKEEEIAFGSLLCGIFTNRISIQINLIIFSATPLCVLNKITPSVVVWAK